MLNVSKALMYEGEEFPFEADVELEDTLLLGDPVVFPGTAHLTGHVKAIGGSVQVRGEMEFTASARCALCLKEASRAMKTTFDAVFALAPNPDNPDLYLYEGKELDLTDMATDAATLALPMQWRCRPDCKGLCPVCGADRNVTSCSCRQDSGKENPFAVLQQLMTEDESEV